MKRIRAILAVLAVGMAALAYAADGDIHTWNGMGSRRDTVEMKLTEPTVGSAANLLPGTDNTNALGSSSFRYSDVRSVLATVTTLTATTVAVTSSVPTNVYAGTYVANKPATQNITSTTTIQVTGSYINLASTGPLTVTATPNIATQTVTAGTVIWVLMQASTITLQDQTALTNSGLGLESAGLGVTTSTARGFLFNGAIWKHIN